MRHSASEQGRGAVGRSAPRRGGRALAALAAAALTLPLLAAPASAVDPLPDTPTTSTARFLSGWFPYWYGDAELTRIIGGASGATPVVGEVMPFWLYSNYRAARSAPVCVHDGSDVQSQECALTAPTTSQRAQLARMKAAGLTVMPSFTDAGSRGYLAAAMKSTKARAALVAGMTSFITRNGFDGLDLDYEGFAFRDGSSSWAATRPAWVAFVKDLASALHARGKKLSVTVPADNPQADSGGYWVYAWSQIIGSIDRLRIMTYDYHFDSAGAIGPADWVDAIAASAVGQLGAAGARKVWLGIAAYGYDWTVSSSGACGGGYSGSGYGPKREGSPGVLKTRYAALPASAIVNPLTWDATAAEYTYTYKQADVAQSRGCYHVRTVWFQDARSHVRRAGIAAKYHLGGVALWAFGDEETSTWTKLVAAAPGIAPVRPVVVLAAPRYSPAGRSATVSVKVSRPDRTALAGVPVLLLWRPTAGGDWRTVLSGTTASDGSARFTPTPTRNGVWQVQATGAFGRQAARSSVVGTSLRQSVSLTLARTGVRAAVSTIVPTVLAPSVVGATVRRAAQVRAGGRVAPFTAGQRVTLYRLGRTGKWVEVSTVRVGVTGAYSFVLPTTAAGTITYLIGSRWTADYAPGYSPRLVFTVR